MRAILIISLIAAAGAVQSASACNLGSKSGTLDKTKEQKVAELQCIMHSERCNTNDEPVEATSERKQQQDTSKQPGS